MSGLAEARIRQIPKLELHVHLESTMPGEMLARFAARQGRELPRPAERLYDCSAEDLSDFLAFLDNICSFVRTPEELAAFRKGHGKAIALRTCFPDAVPGSYIPVFWSPVHFPSAKPCGAIIDAGHPALAGFPTGRYPDYQWQSLFDSSYNMLLPLGACPIIETVPNFTDNIPRSPLFELHENGAHILCCGFDLTSPHPAARQLKESITRYMK